MDENIDSRIPVLLLTGYLGSGKTTLLTHWLRDPLLAEAALVINEIGEVGLDDRLVGVASESVASLVANACVCCTGLPGLEEAMAELYWARLHRRIPRFPWLVIETTGLADPRPVVEAMSRDALLRQRYRLAGVVATVSAPGGGDVLDARSEASGQVSAAQVVLVTKMDAAAESVTFALRKRLRELNPHAVIATSSLDDKPSAAWLLDTLSQRQEAATDDRPPVEGSGLHLDQHEHEHEHEHGGHVHGSLASFVPLPNALPQSSLAQHLGEWQRAHGAGLLRIKGLVVLEGRGLCSAQWSIGDERFEVRAFGGKPGRLGLTLITATH